MKTLEELKTQHAKEVEALQEKLKIAEIFTNYNLPIPDHIGGNLFGAIPVNYFNPGKDLRSLSDAIEMFKKSPSIVPMNVLKSACTILHPEKDLPLKEKEQGYKIDTYRSGDYAANISVHYIADSPRNTSASFEFFTHIERKLFKISIVFGTGYIGDCPQLRPLINEYRNSAGKVTERKLQYNPKLRELADVSLTFAGERNVSAQHVYLFACDNEHDCLPSECEAALKRLQELVEQTGV